MVATDSLLIYSGIGYNKASKIEIFNYDKISSLEFNKGWMPTAKIKFTVSNNKIEVTGCKVDKARVFVSAVNQLVDNYFKIKEGAQRSKHDLAGQLEKLFELKQRGILIEEEFQAQKRKRLI